jgi:hypothetical protein
VHITLTRFQIAVTREPLNGRSDGALHRQVRTEGVAKDINTVQPR